MGQRIDYNNDPSAPPANSVRPSAGAFVSRDGAVLLICRSDNGNWSMPGGAHDPGESLSHTAVRETEEETGITVQLNGIVGIFTDPRHVIHYTSNDEVRQEFTVVYRASYVSGEPTPSSESTRVEWVASARIPELKMDTSQRKRIEWALTQTEPFIDPATE
ncbi:NUDIX domain-containing protein [Aldersonia sp. NBC_00410]|uniref:NUDIX hydrolase n=1 Tax=Aldersonia sp. NBC_00410 TaxID=2975954 RepID=UPI00224E96AE|nr:NUDIX domain-containing protein [Aldersonia sp. NBC_00410]MCX5042518.1 NUDIX domain-containing protein [Aldersonia sp. NBC_00410]